MDGLPIEVHVFEHEGIHFVFDVRNYAIVRLPAIAAEIISRISSSKLDDIESSLSPKYPADEIRCWYAQILSMIEDGVFSTTAIPRPKRPPFHRLVIMLAGGCNMGCTYCFERDVPVYQKPNLLTQEKADEILEWYFKSHEGNKAHVQFYGGEPLMNFPILIYVLERMEEWAAGKDIALSKYLITNGTLLNDRIISYLKEHNVSVQISIDGAPNTHDAHRVMKSGEATMKRIAPRLKKALDSNLDVNLRAVVTSNNTDVQNVTDGLKAYGAEHVSFEVVASGVKNIDLSAEQWQSFLSSYKDLLNQPFTTWSELPHDMQRTIVRICENEHMFYGCGAGVSEVTVAPDGNIFECQRLYKDPYANVASGRRPQDSEFLTMVDDREICKGCWARYLCGGGCLHQSYTEHGTLDPLPTYCEMKRNLVEASGRKIAEIRSLRAPAS